MKSPCAFRRFIACLFVPFVVCGAALVAAQSRQQLPAKPLALPAPPAPSSNFRGQDLSKDDPARLAAVASGLASDGNNREAAQVQYWAVKLGADGRYNLACWTALIGDVDGAFYWLQEAALEDGVEASWAGEDTDLESLRKDFRWTKVAPFLKQCNAYWAVSGRRDSALIVPKGYKPGTPIGVLIGLHGMGHRPDGFIDSETYQEFADKLNMAVVGVSGTVPTGRNSYVWSEDPSADAAQIRKALDELAPRLTVKKGHLIAFGFSQGAEMGFEVAFQNPEDYRGAIVMSPGTSDNTARLKKLNRGPRNKNQGYVFLCGADEHPGNVAETKDGAGFAKKAGARVELKLYEGVKRHAFPPDFDHSFLRWVRFIEGEATPTKPR
jgi:predicted esterase